MPVSENLPPTILLGDVLWRRRDQVAIEHCRVSELPDLRTIHGCVLSTLEGRPYRVDYLIRADRGWNTRAVLAQTTHGLIHRRIELERDASGRWTRDRERLTELDGVVDIDLAITPSTNTLPIRRLSLEPGGEARVDAGWIGFPGLEVERLSQRYLRENEGAYRYESGGGSFNAGIEVDEQGIVIRYGDLWERVVP